MFFAHLKKESFAGLLLLFGIAYLYGILSTEHFIMFGNSFYLSVLVTAVFSASAYFGLRAVILERIGFSTLTWLGLAIIVAIQPMVNSIAYPDALIFPFGLFLLSAIFSVVALNMPTKNKQVFIDFSAWLFLIVGLLSVGTQFLQLFFPNTLDFIAKLSPLARPYGNISQPNHASFVSVLAITSIFYLYHQHYLRKKMTVFFVIAFLLLVMGISFSMSRAGLILLAVSVFGSLFYAWQSYKQRFLILFAGVLLAVVGYQLGIWLLVNFFSLYQGGSSAERLASDGIGLRWVLWDRAWSAFGSNPVFGIGYDNYLAHGLQNIEMLDWFEPADNSHNIISHIAAEYGIIGLTAICGVALVLFKKLILFLQKKLQTQELFVCILLALFVLFSFSEFPLWYHVFLLPFVFLVGLLDTGFQVKNFNIKKIAVPTVVVLSLLAILYTGLYRHNLHKYEIVTLAHVTNQEKIDAYQSFPEIFGFRKTKEYMLHHLVDDEDEQNAERLIEMGDRLMVAVAGMDIARVQVRLLMKTGKQEEADKLNRRLCIWEYQHFKQCDNVKEQILSFDPEDKMGYAKRLSEWYNGWLLTRK